MTEVEKLAKYNKWNMPTKCPLCNTSLVLTDTHSRLYCSNDLCYSYAYSRICKWISNNEIMDIAGATVETLLDNGLIEDIDSLYEIDWNSVEELDGFGKKSVQNMKKEINSHREMDLVQFLSGFNIRGMGWKQIEKMLFSEEPYSDTIERKTYNSLKDVLSEKNYKHFMTVGIGKITAKAFYDGLQQLKPLIKRVAKYITIIKPEQPSSDLLNGKSFCFTGKIIGYSRTDLESLVIENGGKVAGVSKNLTALVTDEPNSGSSKNIKAKELGVPVLTSKQFLKMVK